MAHLVKQEGIQGLKSCKVGVSVCASVARRKACLQLLKVKSRQLRQLAAHNSESESSKKRGRPTGEPAASLPYDHGCNGREV